MNRTCLTLLDLICHFVNIETYGMGASSHPIVCLPVHNLMFYFSLLWEIIWRVNPNLRCTNPLSCPVSHQTLFCYWLIYWGLTTHKALFWVLTVSSGVLYNSLQPCFTEEDTGTTQRSWVACPGLLAGKEQRKGSTFAVWL